MKLLNFIIVILFSINAMAMPLQNILNFKLFGNQLKILNQVNSTSSDDVDTDEDQKNLPKNNVPEEVCANCIKQDAKPGDYIEAGGQIWRLSFYWQEKGTWIGDYIGIASPNAKEPVMGTSVSAAEQHNPDVEIGGGKVKYKGKSVDETFGKNPDTVANGIGVRWMNAHISDLDESIGNGRINSADVDEVSGMVYSAVGGEAEGILNSLDATLNDSLTNAHHGQCDETRCSSEDTNFDGEIDGAVEGQDVSGSNDQNPLDDVVNPKNQTNFEKYVSYNTYAVVPASGQYQSDLKPELDKVHSKLDQVNAKSVMTQVTKQKAYDYLKKSDQAALSGQRENATSFLKIAQFLADIITDLNVFTSVPKDLFKAISGVDPLTGEDLSAFDRVLSVGFAVAAIGTAGMSNTVKLGVKEIVAAVKADSKAAKVSIEGLSDLNKALKAEASIGHEVANAVKNETGIGVKEVVTSQAGKPYTIIGQQMGRVESVAAALRKEGKEVSVFRESNEALADWNNSVKSYGRLNKEQAHATLSFKENRTWLESDLKKGNNVIALDEIVHESFAFDMEKEIVADHLVNKLQEVTK